MMKKLNLGCGQFPKAGYVNLDVSPLSKAEILHDLNAFPYPFEANAFDLIEADHVLEHLADPFGVMRELHRISKPGGQIQIRVPHFSRALTHPQHKAGFDVSFPLYFMPDKFGAYTGLTLHLQRMTLRWFAQKYLMQRILPRWLYVSLSMLGAVIDAGANLSPSFCSRVWCFWVGGFQEIEFIFEKPLTTTE